MKKMFAASLVAIMAVSAANAEIASVSYTDKAIEAKTGNISELATTARSNLTAAVNELAGKVGTQDVGAQVSAALDSAKDYTDALADGAVKTNTQAIAALDSTYATDTALNDGLALKQDKAKMLDSLEGFTGSKAEYYPTVNLMNTAIADANNEVGGDIADLADTVSDLSDTVSSNKTAADTGIQEAKDAAAAASTAAGQALADAKTYADGSAAQALADAKADAAKYIDATELEASQTSQNTTITNAYTAADSALETKITDAYKAADTSLKTELEGKISAASGSAAGVASDLAEYKTSNNAAVEAAQAQADKGVADAAAAKKAADDAQADADANATAISKLGETYATDAELNTAKSDIKTAYEAADATTLSSAKTYAKEYADGLAGNYATAAQGVKADSAVQKADVTTGTTNGTIKVQGQEVSVAGLGSAAYTASTAYATAEQGEKADTAMQESALKGLASWSSAGCATGTCSLVSKSGTIQWEAVKYAE